MQGGPVCALLFVFLITECFLLLYLLPALCGHVQQVHICSHFAEASGVFFGHRCVAGVGVLLCAMCLSVLLLCLRALFLQVSVKNRHALVNALAADSADQANRLVCVSDTGQCVRSLGCMSAV